MRNILIKELRLSASPITYFFIAFGLMFLIPGYPVLCAAFFVTLGIFFSFQSAREANDIVFSVLLPIAKSSVVKGKFLFVCLIELCALLVMGLATVLRMTVLQDSPVYLENALMNANLFALGAALFIFGLFNWIFVGGFFKTAYQLGRPFFWYAAAAFLSIGVFETLHHIPGLEAVNAFGTEHIGLQMLLLAAGLALYAGMTLLSLQTACRRFERIDL